MLESLFNKVSGGACNFIEKGTLVHVFSCEFCEIIRNTFFMERLWETATGLLHNFAETKNLSNA